MKNIDERYSKAALISVQRRRKRVSKKGWLATTNFARFFAPISNIFNSFIHQILPFFPIPGSGPISDVPLPPFFS